MAVQAKASDEQLEGRSMKPDELCRRLKSNTAPLIVDARKTSLFKESRIPGALHAKVPWILLGTVRFPDDKNTEMVITCEHGPRSWLAMKLLAFRGYRNMSMLEGHMLGWKRAGLPLER
jgi:hydroxyacylglutathione hydrolase